MKDGNVHLFRVKYRVYHLKSNPSNQALRYRNDIKAVLPTKWTDSLSPWMLGCCCRLLLSSSQRSRCVALKSFAAVRRARRNSYPHLEVQNKGLATFRDTGSVYGRQYVRTVKVRPLKLKEHQPDHCSGRCLARLSRQTGVSHVSCCRFSCVLSDTLCIML